MICITAIQLFLRELASKAHRFNDYFIKSFVIVSFLELLPSFFDRLKCQTFYCDCLGVYLLVAFSIAHFHYWIFCSYCYVYVFLFCQHPVCCRSLGAFNRNQTKDINSNLCNNSLKQRKQNLARHYFKLQSHAQYLCLASQRG